MSDHHAGSTSTAKPRVADQQVARNAKFVRRHLHDAKSGLLAGQRSDFHGGFARWDFANFTESTAQVRELRHISAANFHQRDQSSSLATPSSQRALIRRTSRGDSATQHTSPRREVQKLEKRGRAMTHEQASRIADDITQDRPLHKDFKITSNTKLSGQHRGAVEESVKYYVQHFHPEAKGFRITKGFGRSLDEPVLHAIGRMRARRNKNAEGGGITSSGVPYTGHKVYAKPGIEYDDGVIPMRAEDPGKLARIRSSNPDHAVSGYSRASPASKHLQAHGNGQDNTGASTSKQVHDFDLNKLPPVHSN
ncbi:hypothetical protein IE81DRAFT_362752 [Ceraceosorus guamensis]|uniref:Uncharacterized protein n=1 Tax=Ceraceosorus guamensis TaxID=1522189 RepID=A0A316W531_9BASI|nr:hypothetical protein IE81DRAFT_362752 [Ceraceosorus guamensis]PWN44694.1 hypothetical protein IE81DRAFT_362752 [Ceraceosorus guamensis]